MEAKVAESNTALFQTNMLKNIIEKKSPKATGTTCHVLEVRSTWSACHFKWLVAGGTR